MSAKNQFRRGFKAEAERIALELRGELHLGIGDALDPAALAAHLLIPVMTLGELRFAAASDVRHLLGRGRTEFSAVTICYDGRKRLIVVNPAHATTRKVSSVCHEIGHVALDHEPELPPPDGGAREWNGVQEREADWLAGCLLIPALAAHAAARAGRSDDDVADAFGVSSKLAAWRMNATGARIVAGRSSAFRRVR